jgi:hypothetical protein
MARRSGKPAAGGAIAALLALNSIVGQPPRPVAGSGSTGVAAAAQSPASHPSSLVWSRVLGGRAADDAQALAVQSDGAVVIGGSAGSATLPTTPGAFSRTKQGAFDGFLARLSPDGRQYEFLTYLGGTGSEAIVDIAIDVDGTILAVGYTTSNDFPMPPAGRATYGGYADGFVVRFDPTGSRLLGGMFLGGPGNDYANAVALDALGRVYVAGEASRGFPATGAINGQGHAGASDVFVARLAPDLLSADYITLVGGSRDDCISCSMTVTADGRAVIVSQTDSTDLPTTALAFDATHNGANDAYVARLSGDGSTLEFATYLGGSGAECGAGCSIALDAGGGVWIAGTTLSDDFPEVPGPRSSSRGADAFLAHLESDGQVLSLARKYVGAQTELVRDIDVTADGDVLMLMRTDSADLPVTADAFDPHANGASDLVLLQLAAPNGDVVYGTYIGSLHDEGGLLPRVVSGTDGRVYAVGGTFSTVFPGSGSSMGGQVDGKGNAFALMFAPPPPATPTPPAPSNLYLPVALRERCSKPFLDAVLVIDASISMQDLDASGRPKVDAVVAAAEGFAASLRMEGGQDRAAVVSFNHTAHLLSGLTHDRTAVVAALRSTETSSHSRMHLGIDLAAELLADERSNAFQVILVFSDGNTSPEPGSVAVESAASARARGIIIYTIGFGENVDESVLRAIAGDPSRYVDQSDGDKVGRLSVLISAIRCSNDVFWPYRDN